jgi:hypothetical protein
VRPTADVDVTPVAVDQLRHHLRVHRGAARRHPVQRVEEVVERADAVLQQVPDAAEPVREQVGGVAGLHVLGEDQHRLAGPLGPQPDRGAQTLVTETGRRPHVRDGDVRAVLDHGGQQRVGVADRGHHLVALAAQDVRDALAQEQQVLGQHYPVDPVATAVTEPGLRDAALRPGEQPSGDGGQRQQDDGRQYPVHPGQLGARGVSVTNRRYVS